jgi:2-methylcitrate dehydratase PrpD
MTVIAESLARGAANARVSPAMRETAERLSIDIAGLCVAAREADYVRAALDAWEADGQSTAIGTRDHWTRPVPRS